ncbi:DUF924 domain-containing protein [Salinispirillum sp. LH 10-3-1]|uniref:DUF924 domain-containing protein n=1 Tax=Salinispirillum sp. LH 10-3-1 TaxID=2952525 RepID=A0AB38YFC8_9GAMM
MQTAQDVLTFWFQELTPKDWFTKSSELDHRIAERFSSVHRAATRCETVSWRGTPAGRLAEVIVLDQFSRNIFRDHPESFAYDGLALALAQEAVALGVDDQLDSAQARSFLYMPYMHSESPLIHETAMRLFSHPDLADNLDFEQRHKDIIDRFGRYPHRNRILGRTSTPEEIAFLQQPGSSF